MQKLDKDYTYEVDNVDEKSWNEIIQIFDDANIYQTWSYDNVRFGREKISHLILKKHNDIVAVVQARILKIPIINIGVAYIRWGPLWQKDENSVEVLQQIIRALKNEYVINRNLILRLFPRIYENDLSNINSILINEGFKCIDKKNLKRTLVVDLKHSIEELRKGFKGKWRNCLNSAEKNNLEIIEGYNDELFEQFISLYKEMLKRKKFIEPNDINEFREIQKELPVNMKMRIILCKSKNSLCAGAIYSAIGNTGLYLFGAINEIGMSNKSSYLVQWKAINWLKQMQCSFNDLNGINPEKNPGTYRFKAGISGKYGEDVHFIGRFDSYKSFHNALFARYGDLLLSNYKSLKGHLKAGLGKLKQ